MSGNPSSYELYPLPAAHGAAEDLLRQASRKHMIHAFIELDVTLPRRFLRQHRDRTGQALSFTAFVVTCLAKAVDQDKRMHAYRNWRNRLVAFDEVDVNTMVEREVNGQRVGRPNILRAANLKSYLQLHSEIRAAQQVQTEAIAGMQWFRWAAPFGRLPAFVRGWVWRIVAWNPQWIKAFAGTVGVTAVGMFAPGAGWGMTVPLLTLNAVLGGIAAKPRVVEGRIEPREILHVTLSFDHDVIGGAQAARFTQRFKELVESANCLADLKR